MKFSKYHIDKYKNSSYCTDKYKNMSVDQLHSLQDDDPQLKKEITFNNLLTRFNSKQTKLFKNYDSNRNKSKLKEIEILKLIDNNKNQQQIKKIELPVVHEVILQESTSKNYRNLFGESITQELWTKQELVLRDQYLKEIQQLLESNQGCSNCKKNAIIRKYILKAQKLFQDSQS